MKEMSGEVGDGFDFRFEEKPAPFQTFLQLRFLQKVPLLELQTNPHALHGRLTSVRERRFCRAMCCFGFLNPQWGFDGTL